MTKSNTPTPQIWQSKALRYTALAALVGAEGVAAWFAGQHAGDALGASVMIGMSAMAGLGVALGPSFAMGLRRKAQRTIAWMAIMAAFFVSGWNLSNVIDWNRLEQQAAAVRSAPGFAADVTRLASLNRMVDALDDEGGEILANNISERDRLQERLDKANVSPVVWAGLSAWSRAILFHGLVLGFSAGFAAPIVRAKRKAKARSSVKREGNVRHVQF